MNDKISREKVHTSKHFEETIVMLENVLETRDQTIYDLEEDLKRMEENSSASPLPACKNCLEAETSQNILHKHETIEHTDEDKPSTSKCGKCEYESEDESDIEMHMKSSHEFNCNLCNFQTDMKDKFDTHELFEHNFPCSECLNIFRTPIKLKDHICKLEVINPEFGSFYIKNWLDGNGCNAIYCSEQGQELAILHCQKCVSNQKKCGWTPFTLSIKNNGVTHLELEKYAFECKMRYREILWPKLAEDTN